jgi:hypothetical protein
MSVHETTSTEQEVAVDYVLAERRYQVSKWGDQYNDDDWKNEEWEQFVLDYLNGPRGASYSFAKRMQKVAALATAALESEIRKGRRPE